MDTIQEVNSAILSEDNLLNEGQNIHKEHQDDKLNEAIIMISQIVKLHDYIKEKDRYNKWNCKNYMIDVMGVERKIGATTVAFQLLSYLQGGRGKGILCRRKFT